MKLTSLLCCIFFLFPQVYASSCNRNPGFEDSYILALTWQPGFCRAVGYNRKLPECLNVNPNGYHRNHLVLHGLWPDQHACGRKYQFCGVLAKGKFCDYPSIEFNEGVSKKLAQFMPSYSAGTCLERHEWNKHGSCQIRAFDEYFSLAIRLNEELNQTLFAECLKQNLDKSILKAEIYEVIERSFGQGALSKINLACKGDIFLGIYVSLPSLISEGHSLQALINTAPDFALSNACPDKIRIVSFKPD